MASSTAHRAAISFMRRQPLGQARSSVVLALVLLSLLARTTWALTGYTVGGNGVIFKSENGSSWSSLTSGSGAVLTSAYSIHPDTAWASGGQVILKTGNHGSTWVNKYTTGSDALNSVFFVNSALGWAVGASGAIAKSTDRGETWTDQTKPVTVDLNSVYFIHPDTGWVAGGQVILKTTNRGSTWADKYLGPSVFKSVFFVNSVLGWAVGSSGAIAKSTDGGEHWTDLPPLGSDLNSVYFISPDTGWVAGSTVILKTTDRGVTWTDKYTGGATLQSVYFFDSMRGWAVGSGGNVDSTVDGGEHWGELTLPAGGATFRSVIFPKIAVTVDASPVGRSLSVDGATFTTSRTFYWVPGSTHTIATISPQSGGFGVQYVWTGWSDGGAISHTVTPTNAATYTASFKTQYLLTTNAGSGGSVSPPTGFQDAASAVSVTATPNAGFTFSGWTGTGSGSYTGANNPASVTMNAPITESGSFAPIILSATVGTSPAGRSFTVDGTTYTSSQIFSWTYGSSHTVSTTSPQSGGAGVQYAWLNWSDGGAISHTVVPTAATTYTANFKTQYFLTMAADAGGTVSPSSGFRDAASTVSVSAASNSGFVFSAWTGSGPGSYTGPNNPVLITMNGPITETGGFSPAVSATVTTVPPGLAFSADGVAYTSPQTFAWASGSPHTISATSPQAGGTGTQYAWVDWSDGGALSHAVAPTAAATYVAEFKTQFLLAVSGDAGGTVAPSSEFQDRGSNLAITATPNPASSFIFDHWEGAGLGSYRGQLNPAPVIVDGPISETAHFLDAAAASVLLALRFNGASTGELGETPTVETGVTYESDRAWGTGANLAVGNQLRYGIGGNIDPLTGTVEFYIKPHWNGNDNQDHYALALGLSGGILIGKDAGNFWRIILNRFGGAVGPELGAGLYVDGWVADKWHHAAFTWGPDAIKVYIDGQLKVTEVPAAAPPPVSAPELQLGADDTSAYLNGVLDDVRIFGVERTAQEILADVWRTTDVDESGNAIAPGFRLGHITPNPTASRATLTIQLGEAGTLRVDVFDVHGRHVRTLIDGTLPAGRKIVSWDGISASGTVMGSGVYWLVGRYAGTSISRKLILVR